MTPSQTPRSSPSMEQSCLSSPNPPSPARPSVDNMWADERPQHGPDGNWYGMMSVWWQELNHYVNMVKAESKSNLTALRAKLAFVRSKLDEKADALEKAESLLHDQVVSHTGQEDMLKKRIADLEQAAQQAQERTDPAEQLRALLGDCDTEIQALKSAIMTGKKKMDAMQLENQRLKQELKSLKLTTPATSDPSPASIPSAAEQSTSQRSSS